MNVNKFLASLVGLTLFCLWLSACGATPAPASTPTESLALSEPTGLDCPTYHIYSGVSTEQYEWSLWVLENIEPGVTQFDEVEQMLGQPTEVYRDTWLYNPGLGEVGLNVYRLDEDNIVDEIGISHSMSLGQLIETFGEPSRVYRSAENAPDDTPPGSLLMTVLFYDSRHLQAIIFQGLCSFPSHLPVDLIEGCA
jgi:hypothetical protein